MGLMGICAYIDEPNGTKLMFATWIVLFNIIYILERREKQR